VPLIIYSYEIIINPTGGYKGIVPFLTVLGMIYGKYSVYLFEFSQELIKLPPLPLTFNLDLYERVKYALKYIDQEIAITQDEYGYGGVKLFPTDMVRNATTKIARILVKMLPRTH
jgi:hypothetical protein